MSFGEWFCILILILFIIVEGLGFYWSGEIEDGCVKSSWRVYNQFDTLQDIYECGNGKTYIIQ